MKVISIEERERERRERSVPSNRRSMTESRSISCPSCAITEYTED